MKFPVIRYLLKYPSRRVVKVKVELLSNNNIYKITSLEPTVNINDDDENSKTILLVDLILVTLHETRKKAEKSALENLHEEFSKERRKLREQQRQYKISLNRIAEYKKFKQIQSF